MRRSCLYRQPAFSFANLMELRFIAFFTDAGVSLNEIRMVMDEVRVEIMRPHPFATNLVFKTDGEKVVAPWHGLGRSSVRVDQPRDGRQER